jgi:hypothetical protein
MIALGLLRALGLRGTIILACLLVLFVTAYGVAQDLGLIEAPAKAAPARKRPAAGQPSPSRAAVADIPAGYLRLYRSAGARYRIPWPVLAAIGKVESDHGRVRLPGVRSGSNWGRGLRAHADRLCAGQQGRQQLGPLRPRPPPRPRPGDPGRGPVPGRPRRPPQPGPGPVRLQPLPLLRRPGQAAGPPLQPRRWATVTLATHRCVPKGGRSRPRPPTPSGGFLADAISAKPTGPAPAVDVYGRPSHRPPWLAGEYLALLEAQGRGVGVIYLLHFDRPIGDLANPRGFAGHYTGWTHDLPARLAAHAAGRGARLMEVVGEAGIGWQLARIWTGTRARERQLKQRGAARRCPVCQLIPLGLQPPRPVDPLALELGRRAAGFTALAPLEPPPAVAA